MADDIIEIEDYEVKDTQIIETDNEEDYQRDYNQRDYDGYDNQGSVNGFYNCFIKILLRTIIYKKIYKFLISENRYVK